MAVQQTSRSKRAAASSGGGAGHRPGESDISGVILRWLCVLSSWICLDATGATAPTGEQLAFFESRIRPVLVERCYECHSSTSRNLKGGLKLDSREGLLRGGDTRAAIVPGDADRSLLMEAIRYKNQDLQMPPKSKLPESVAEDFARWINMGAPDPRTSNASPAVEVAKARVESGNHWAFQPIAKFPGKRSVDSFIESRLKTAGLSLSAPAEKAVLARRLHFGLTGLPPSPAELDQYLQDRSRNATVRLMERLLESDHYGERWARWWLDLARYADTNGQDENKVMSNAWRYRDWVIHAFQENLPIDRFIQMQLAGDLMPGNGISQRELYDRYTATGFLVLGPKMLAEQDKPKLSIDIVDEQLDTTSRAFLGLTLGCARCHDHKYDPIPTRDYYAMAGIFKSTRTMENLAFVSKFNERWLAPETEVSAWKQKQKDAASKQKELEAAIKKANEALGKPLPEKPREKYPSETLARINELESEKNRLEKEAALEPPRALGVEEAGVTNLAVHIRGSHLNLADHSIPRGFIDELKKACPPPEIPQNQSGRLELAQWLTNPNHPLTARVMVNRIWQAHFGEGLVRTPDNFGLRGEPPSHPELLDWLAGEFIRSGWDMKHIHRLIVSSKTYQQSSTLPAPQKQVAATAKSRTRLKNADGREKDPENRLLWRYPRQRLEAEMVRDALLAVSGRLETSRGGTLVQWKNDEYAPRDEVSAESNRRTIYLPVVRDRVYDALTIFDFANPSVGAARRFPTVVSHQALFMMNSPLVKKSADALAKSLMKTTEPRTRVDEAYRRVLGRAAKAAEVEQALRFVVEAEPAKRGGGTNGNRDPLTNLETQSWAAFCQALFCANEFLYRD